MPLPRPPRWLFAVKGALAAAGVAVLVWMADPAEVAAAVAHADPGWAALALALVPVNVALEAYRWWRLVRHVAPGVGYRDALRAVVGSYPLGLLTPGRVGDYVGRALYLPHVPAGASAALTFGERMATLAACLTAGLVALGPYLTAQVGASALWPAVTAVGVVATGALVALVVFPSLAQTVIATLVPWRPVRDAVGAFGQIPQDEGAVLLGLSFVRYAVFSGQFVLLAHALAPGAAWSGLWAGVALVFFAKSAIPQVTLGDLGVREGAAVFFLGAYGVGPAAALDASLGLFALNLVLPALAGVPLLLRLRLRRPVDADRPGAARAEVRA